DVTEYEVFCSAVVVGQGQRRVEQQRPIEIAHRLLNLAHLGVKSSAHVIGPAILRLRFNRMVRQLNRVFPHSFGKGDAGLLQQLIDADLGAFRGERQNKNRQIKLKRKERQNFHGHWLSCRPILSKRFGSLIWRRRGPATLAVKLVAADMSRPWLNSAFRTPHSTFEN